MPAKIAGNSSKTNTVEVTLENVTAFGKPVLAPGVFLTTGPFCDITYKQ